MENRWKTDVRARGGQFIKNTSKMIAKSIPKATENREKNGPEKVMRNDAPNGGEGGGWGPGALAAVAILGGPYYATCPSAAPRRGTPSQGRRGEARREGG